MHVDTGRLEHRLGVAPSRIRRVLRNALNDTAKDLRIATPDMLKSKISRPTKFTTRSSATQSDRADYAQGDKMHARIYIANAQAKYLSILEHGGESKNLNQPIASDAYDQHGNTLKRFMLAAKMKTALLSKRHRIYLGGDKTSKPYVGKQFFIGAPKGRSGDKASPGIFWRSQNGKLFRQTLFVKSRRYNPTLHLESRWQSKAIKALPAHLKRQAAMPVNRM